MTWSLAELFPDGDYRFHLTLRRSEPREFFRARDPSGVIRAERAKWLGADPARYRAMLPEGEPGLREFAAIAPGWIPDWVEPPPTSANELVDRLGRALEPDLLFLSADEEGRFRLRGGALCFPSGWALEEKLGHTLDFIHDVVPGLNPALGGPIQQFLSKLRPGPLFLRDNWGVAATEEMNLHPARSIAAPDPPFALDRLWLRVEHQALMALPESHGIVFGIRIALHRLDGIAGGPHARSLRHALMTMPPELVAYKRLNRVRSYLLNML